VITTPISDLGGPCDRSGAVGRRRGCRAPSGAAGAGFRDESSRRSRPPPLVGAWQPPAAARGASPPSCRSDRRCRWPEQVAPHARRRSAPSRCHRNSNAGSADVAATPGVGLSVAWS